MRRPIENRISRRAFLVRTAALCFSAPTLAGLLAACGQSGTAGSDAQKGGTTSTSNRQQGSWETRAPLPTARSEVAVAEAGGKVYVLGGFASQTRSSALNQAYDPATDRWQELASMPRELDHVGAVGLDGIIYVIGGFANQNKGAVADA